MTYDRAVIKLPVEAIAQAQKTLYEPLPTIKVLVPTAETAPQTWRYHDRGPDCRMVNPEFDDSSVVQGRKRFRHQCNTRGLVSTPNGSPMTSGFAAHSSWIPVRCVCPQL